MYNIGKSGEFAKDWGWREWDGKNRENIFVIFPNIQIFSIFAYLVVHTGTGTVHKRTEPVFYGKSARQTPSTEYGTNVSHETSYRQKTSYLTSLLMRSAP